MKDRKKSTKKAKKSKKTNSVKSTASKAVRVTCAQKGCRRKAVKDGLCKQCHEGAVPIEYVEKIQPTEAERWGRLDAEIRHDRLQIKAIELELKAAAGNAEKQIQRIRDEFERTKKSAFDQQQALKVSIEARAQEYIELSRRLATDHGMDPTRVTIDPDACTIREIPREPGEKQVG